MEEFIKEINKRVSIKRSHIEKDSYIQFVVTLKIDDKLIASFISEIETSKFINSKNPTHYKNQVFEELERDAASMMTRHTKEKLQ